jgi:hypothetical protein
MGSRVSQNSRKRLSDGRAFTVRVSSEELSGSQVV